MSEENLSSNETEKVSDDDKKRFEELFDKLDTNKDGSIDIKELTTALQAVAGDSTAVDRRATVRPVPRRALVIWPPVHFDL